MNASRRRFLTTTAVAGSALALGGTAIAADTSDSETSTLASVTFNDQKTDGGTVVVASATLPDGGYVTIHDDRLLDDKPFESVIGVTDELSDGTSEDIEISLFEGVQGTSFDQSELHEDQTLIAMPHKNSNDNGVYEFVVSEGKADEPYTKDGKAVTDDAMITVTAGTDTASVSFDDQTAQDGKFVTVSEAMLPEGGFVAIHDESLLDGDVFDSIIGVSDAFEAGTRPDIHIELFEDVPGRDFDQNALQEDTTLIAMPHNDSDYDGTYDFVTSQGEADGPYTKDGNAVVTKAAISVPDEC